jgi:hypothetical protein
MLFIATQSLPSFIIRKPGGTSLTLAPRQVPLGRWALQVLVLTSSSLLNNWVFKVGFILACVAHIMITISGDSIKYH